MNFQSLNTWLATVANSLIKQYDVTRTLRLYLYHYCYVCFKHISQVIRPVIEAVVISLHNLFFRAEMPYSALKVLWLQVRSDRKTR